MKNIKAVILAGGSGTRLWPLSRKQLPKQFIKLIGEDELIKSTIDRLQPHVTNDDVLVITNKQHATGEAYNILSKYKMLLEPTGRNTAPAIALAAAWLQKYSGEDDPIMMVLPADHVIQDVGAFHKVIEQATISAQDGLLVTFGIIPTRPDTGFGYIKAKGEKNKNSAIEVERFVEKPDLATAKEYIADGNYLWNSGMFVWKASVILEEIANNLPELSKILNKITKSWGDDEDNIQDSIDNLFANMPNISIDNGVLEPVAKASSRMCVIPCDIKWSDIGSWDAVHEVSKKDADNNLISGNAVAIDCKNSLIHSNHRLVTAVGVDDICLVETPDAILLTSMGETQRVREIVSKLDKTDAQEHILHLTVKRPWGTYTILEEQGRFKTKKIVVYPGAKLSLQRHKHRSEHWTVVEGVAKVQVGEKIQKLVANESTYIPIGAVHRLENTGKVDLVIVETQVGEYLGEDDIERLEDDFKR